VFSLQHVSVLGDHHQAIVMNETNTVTELFLIWIHISAIYSCYKIKLLLKIDIDLKIKLKDKFMLRPDYSVKDYEV
jgi:hypothetical protein